jgi:hypothetical protein
MSLLTVPQSGHDSEDGRVEGVAVIVDANHVDVDCPHRFARPYTQGRRGEGLRSTCELSVIRA